MADKESVTLKKGPGEGISLKRPSGNSLVALPLDRDLVPLKTEGDVYAHAIYGPDPVSNEYIFRGAQRVNKADSFDVEFVDGPMAGTHPFNMAIQLTEAVFDFPLDGSLQPLKKGIQVRSIARYRQKLVDGIWKMALVEIVESPDQAEDLSDKMAEHDFTVQLGQFTNQQLVEELVRRQGFLGVVVMYPKELTGPVQMKAGESFAVALSRQLSPSDAKKILQSAVDAL